MALINHCVSSSPVCTPYRGILLTGQHPLHSGVFMNECGSPLPDNGEYFGHVLQKGGYQTAYIGKYHLWTPNDCLVPPGHRCGFDQVFLSNNVTLEYNPGKAHYFDEQGNKVVYHEWEPYGQTAQALDFIDKASAADDPFALFVSWHPPHDEGMRDMEYIYETEPDLMALYDPAKIRLRPGVKDNARIRRYYHGYMSMISGIDRCVKQIVDKLAERGLDRDTIVVFTSDHGDYLGSNGREVPKMFIEDASSRVPFLLRWPGRLPEGKSTEMLFGSLDIMPALLGMMGLPVPPTCQGTNHSADLLAGRNPHVPSIPCFLFPEHDQLAWRGIYTPEYSFSFTDRPLVAWGTPAAWEANLLFDRKKDPWQLRNLYTEKSTTSLRKELFRQSAEHMERFGDRFIPTDALLPRCFGYPPNERPPGPLRMAKGKPVDLTKDIPGMLEVYKDLFQTT